MILRILNKSNHINWEYNPKMMKVSSKSELYYIDGNNIVKCNRINSHY